MTILIIGLGFVGLTAALGFADKGFSVYGYDINSYRAMKIKSGEVPFYEPGLPEALLRNLGSSFQVIDEIKGHFSKYDAIFLCVGTPDDGNGKVDLRYLKSGIDSMVDIATDECLLVIKSTIPPGTTQNDLLPYIRGKGIMCPVAVNPEFLREGWCWPDFTKPDRIVCGVEDNHEAAKLTLNRLYAQFNAPIHFVSLNTAEFIKYISNSLLATLVSFSNEMAAIAESVENVSIGNAFKILHQDNRLAGAGIAHYIYPGCGYGGSCLPKDTAALVLSSKQNGYEPKILKKVIELNDGMPFATAQKIIAKTKSKSDKIGILGLSFKPNSDDVRDSPAAKIIMELLNRGYHDISAYDPISNENFSKQYNLPIKYNATKEEVCESCSVVALVTIWSEFKGINLLYPKAEWIDCRYYL